MSYEISIGVKIADTDIIASITRPEHYDPAYSLGKIFRACTGWEFKQAEWYRVEDVIGKIEHGIHELRFNEKSYMKYNSGWGGTRSALEDLESLYKCIEQCTNGWLFDIPIEHLWVKW